MGYDDDLLSGILGHHFMQTAHRPLQGTGDDPLPVAMLGQVFSTTGRLLQASLVQLNIFPSLQTADSFPFRFPMTDKTDPVYASPPY